MIAGYRLWCYDCAFNSPFNFGQQLSLYAEKPKMKRIVFIVSDSTGITADSLGNGLLAQFGQVEFEVIKYAFVDTVDRANALVQKINQASESNGQRVIVISTFVNKSISSIVRNSECFMIDAFGAFADQLEEELSTTSSHTIGQSHNVGQTDSYETRIQAVHYAFDADDGAKLNKYDKADVILIGVSRSGKTPTCLYLGLHYGVFAANYPITEEDLERNRLPQSLMDQRKKLFGLTIDPMRLASIREARRANSRYASITQCEDEVRQTERLCERMGIPVINTTHCSVEEISTRILSETGVVRKL